MAGVIIPTSSAGAHHHQQSYSNDMPGPHPTSLSVILITSNGVGMGHLTRQLTVALSAQDELDPVLLSLSGALPSVRTAVARGRLPELSGVRTEYCPSRRSGWPPHGGPARRLRQLHPAYGWEAYFSDRIRALVAETDARLVLFDGVVPYAGLRSARRALPDTAFVWMRRGMWRAGVGSQWLEHSDLFDLVVEPGDFAAAGDAGLTATRQDAQRIAPISIADAITLHRQGEARRALGLDPDRPALLLTPGTGALEDVAAPVRAALATVRRHAPDWQVAVTSPALARHGVGNDDGVVLLHDTYPLARSLAAFNAAVSAAGYNSVHELLGAAVPTVLVPGQALGTDDQPGRAATLAAAGACLTVPPDEPRAMADSVARLLDPDTAEELRHHCRSLPATTGGVDAARLLLDLAGQANAPAGLAQGQPWGPPAWRRALPDPRTPVTWPDTDSSPAQGRRRRTSLRLTQELPPHRVGDDPVEHLVDNASAEYRQARQAIAHWIYR